MRSLCPPQPRHLLPPAVAALALAAAMTAGPASAPVFAQAPVCREARAPAPAPLCTAAASGAVPWLLEPTARIAIGGQRAVIDPLSGRLLVPHRPTLALSRRTLDSFRLPHGDLHQQPLPGGGWKLGLQGRMLQPLFATAGPEGRPLPTHAWEPVGEPPAGGDAEAADEVDDPDRRRIEQKKAKPTGAQPPGAGR